MAIVSDSSLRVNADFAQFLTRFPEVFLHVCPERSEGILLLLTTLQARQEVPPFTGRLNSSIAHVPAIRER